MSASREKKQRQNTGPSERSAKLQQEQAAQKRQIIIYSVIGGVVAVLVAALLIWNSGFFQARATALTLGNEQLTTAELSYYYYDARYYYASMGAYLGFDTTKGDDEQFFSEEDNQTYRDYFMETALKSAQRDLALAEQAVKDGHTEDEIRDSLDATIASFKSQASSGGYSYGAYLRAVYGPYMTPEVFEKMTARSLMAQLAKSEKGNALYESYQQSDLDAYYEENADALDTIEYSHLYFAIPTVNDKDADGNVLPDEELNKLKQEAKDGAKKDAEDALEAVKGGSSFQSQIDKYELTTAADHAKVVGTGKISSAYSGQLLAMDQDDCQLVETDSGYYVISFHGRYLVDEPTRDVRHILIQAESTPGEGNKLVAPTDEAWAAAKAKMDEIQAAWDASDKSEDAFAKLANEKSDDGGSNTNGGLYKRVAQKDFVPEFDEWLFDSARKAGDVDLAQHVAAEDALVSEDYCGYHLMYYVGENEPVWMGSARNSLATADLSEWTDGLTESYPAVEAGGASYLGK